mmetsp:Transcript_4368/g.6383  ORF Transcript_4368/g.6383 Transcript_4368/m.6383 type:complete len:189 (+) Transcript_4368:1280-1846(+)
MHDEDPAKDSKHPIAMEKQKPGGYFIHDHTFHKFFKCKKLKDLCEQVRCQASLTAVTTQAHTTSSTSGASGTTATLSARRVKAQLKKDQDEVTAQQEQMVEQQRKMDRQIAKNNAMMKVLKVMMQSQALVNITAGQSRALNPFDLLEMDSDTDESHKNAKDHMDAEDQMDGQFDEPEPPLTTNNDVTS